MSQFSLFDDPAPVAPPKAIARRKDPMPVPSAVTQSDPPVTLKPAYRQPPAVIAADTPPDPDEKGLKPLVVVPSTCKKHDITYAEFDLVRCEYGKECSDHYVLLKMLEARGARLCRQPDDMSINYLFDHVDAPAMMRHRTVPGYILTCWQWEKKT